MTPGLRRYSEWAMIVQQGINAGSAIWFGLTVFIDGRSSELRNVAVAFGVVVATSLLNVAVFIFLTYVSYRRKRACARKEAVAEIMAVLQGKGNNFTPLRKDPLPQDGYHPENRKDSNE